MRNHVTPHDLAFTGAALAGLLFLSWLFGGRRITGAPASSALPQTFVASRIVPATFSVFAIGGFGTCLLMATTLISAPAKDIGPFWFRVFVALITLLFGATSAFGVKLFGTWTIWPDRLCLTEDGVFARLRGRERRWSWDMIADARVRLEGTRYERLELILKEPDPEQVRRLARLPWTRKRDPRILWLDDMWKPTGLLTTGDQSIRNTLRAVLEKRGQLPAR
jgi:hypothetical protein